jgi:hypothetical protein
MSDKELLDWLEQNQACITTANHRFYVEVHSAPDPENHCSLRTAIDQEVKRKRPPYDD